MKYVLVKTVDCSVSSGCYRSYAIGDIIPYRSYPGPTNINTVMKSAHSYNSNNSCACQVEVKEVEQ